MKKKGEESESSSNKDASDTRADDFIFGAVKDVHWLVSSQLSFNPADDKHCIPPYKPCKNDPTKNTSSLLPAGDLKQLASDGAMLRYTDWSFFRVPSSSNSPYEHHVSHGIATSSVVHLLVKVDIGLDWGIQYIKDV